MSPQWTPESAKQRIDILMSHAWMVRTFLKHSPEIEDDLEWLQIPRTIFDVVRALETRADRDPDAYLKMVRKKFGKLKAVAETFRAEQPEMSDHTNFKQAVISLDTVVAEIEQILARLED